MYFIGFECKFMLQLVPSGNILVLNMASVLHDETVFEEPDNFKPERYLTGDVALKKQRTMAFGIGKQTSLVHSLTGYAVIKYNY